VQGMIDMSQRGGGGFVRGSAPRMSRSNLPASSPGRLGPASIKGSVLVIQHVAAEPPGLVKDVLEGAGWEVALVKVYRDEPVPRTLGRHAGLVVMGGPMGVCETDRYPFLEAEQRLMKATLERERPVLGICLGSQLLAATLGAPVVPNVRREIGWHAVHFTQFAAHDNLWSGVSDDLVAFHWHGDRFDPPKNAESLAWSGLTDCQAFRWGRSAYGILFHLEVNQRAVDRMTTAFQAELLSTGQRPEDIRSAASVHLPGLQRVGREVLARWARLMGRE
jgi:GMP synthase (glutamine-hydrolysing)